MKQLLPPLRIHPGQTPPSPVKIDNKPDKSASYIPIEELPKILPPLEHNDMQLVTTAQQQTQQHNYIVSIAAANDSQQIKETPELPQNVSFLLARDQGLESNKTYEELYGYSEMPPPTVTSTVSREQASAEISIPVLDNQTVTDQIVFPIESQGTHETTVLATDERTVVTECGDTLDRLPDPAVINSICGETIEQGTTVEIPGAEGSEIVVDQTHGLLIGDEVIQIQYCTLPSDHFT